EGMDVARALYLDLTGQPVPAGAAANGRKWLVEDLDLVAAFRSPRETSLTAWNWLKSLRGVQETAFLDFKDPLPALMMLRSDANELARRARPGKGPVPPFERKAAAAPDEKHAYL